VRWWSSSTRSESAPPMRSRSGCSSTPSTWWSACWAHPPSQSVDAAPARASLPETDAAPRLRWWRELLYIAAFYGVYTLVRNRGLSPNEHVQAFHNAKRVIGVERFLGTFHERYVQHLFLGWHWFIKFWDVYY